MVFDILCIWRGVVRNCLVIYEGGIGEQCTASGVSRWVVGGGSLTALEDLELRWIRTDGAVLVDLRLENAIKVIRHSLASG